MEISRSKTLSDSIPVYGITHSATLLIFLKLEGQVPLAELSLPPTRHRIRGYRPRSPACREGGLTTHRFVSFGVEVLADEMVHAHHHVRRFLGFLRRARSSVMAVTRCGRRVSSSRHARRHLLEGAIAEGPLLVHHRNRIGRLPLRVLVEHDVESTRLDDGDLDEGETFRVRARSVAASTLGQVALKN